MGQKTKVVYKNHFENRKRHLQRKKRIQEKSKEIPSRYEGDIKQFLKFCYTTEQDEVPETMLDYLYVSLTEERIKITTWERRLAAIKKYLTVTHGYDFLNNPEVADEISVMRKLYDEEQYADLIQLKGKSPVSKTDLLEMIDKLTTRAKAICLVNLITANRPNEMVRLKIKDFDLEGSFVSIYLKKQKDWHNKRLTPEVVKAVREYIKEYKLKPDDYFVGHVYKNDRYESKEISETAYRKALKNWTGLTPYNFRKTQVAAMHNAGADLSTIAKQTGHKSLQTLSKHYLSVSDSTVDKFL